jgi:YHS domain-containing protein
MAKMLGARQAYVSQHLLILKKSKVVVARRDGKEMYYAVSDPRIMDACDALYSLVSEKPLSAAPEPIVIDPVCGMKLTPSLAVLTTEYNGVRQYFCGQGCLKEFHANH